MRSKGYTVHSGEGQKIIIIKIKTVAKDELKSILGTPSRYTRTRDSAVLDLIFGCGLRIGEMCSLKLSDIVSVDTGVIDMTGKNKKTRTIYAPSEVRKALKAYMEDRMQIGGTIYSLVPREDWNTINSGRGSQGLQKGPGYISPLAWVGTHM
ncbi:MAG: tyrosine-type recombinase/integrase [Candidatus Thermoplasmatota archaeon]|nr:tyrosine-type recombinase/integrase [Candidatus Thermoplasmatota archaeon]